MTFQAPNEKVLMLAAPIRELAELLLANRPQILKQLGRWESEVEAINLISLAATHAFAASSLARSSTSLLPAVIPLARATMESGARSYWLLGPSDPFEREARWLAHLEGEVSIQKRLETAFSSAPENSIHVRKFLDGVRSKMPPNIVIPKQVPKFDEMLRSIGMPEKYTVYAFLSQTTHATHHGLSSYRKHLGSMKTFGDFSSPADWWLPLSTIWWFLAKPVAKLNETCQLQGLDLLPVALQEQFIAAQAALRD